MNMGDTKSVTVNLVAGAGNFSFTQLEPVKSAYNPNEVVYMKYTVKNNGSAASTAGIDVKDLDTGAIIASYSIASLQPGYSFMTTGTHARVGSMPNKSWRLSFTVTP